MHLGVEVGSGDVDAAALAAIVTAHVARVPYETIDISRGRPPGIDPVASVERIVAGRGGYCYHLNGALHALLDFLEVDATPHIAGVQSRAAPGPRLNANHLGITARTPDGREWLVDAGLGEGPREPLELVPGTVEQDGFRYSLAPSTLDPNGWRLEHDPSGSFVGVDIAGARAPQGAFAAMHLELSSEPESPFVRTVTVQRRAGGTLEQLRACTHAIVTATSEQRHEITTCDEWWSLVIDGFGLAYGDVTAAEQAAVWRHARAAHEAWLATG